MKRLISRRAAVPLALVFLLAALYWLLINLILIQHLRRLTANAQHTPAPAAAAAAAARRVFVVHVQFVGFFAVH